MCYPWVCSTSLQGAHCFHDYDSRDVVLHWVGEGKIVNEYNGEP